MMYFVSSFFLFLFGLLLFFLSLGFIYCDYVIFMDWEILSLNSCSISMVLLFDWMSIMFMSFVMIISSMVLLYSYSYMCWDMNSIRFMMLVLMFIVSMLFMIVSPNLVSILLGWDGLGLVSYSLVVYFQNYKSYNAGMMTVLINRVGDAALLMAIAWMFNFGGWHYLFYFCVWDYNMMIVLFLVILAGFTSSAQIPFSSWLPVAMAAPTPVSALVHSSTLVTAGVYLLIRFEYMFVNINTYIFAFIGVMTMFVAGLGAIFEYDLSKIIALSTLSQLGLMVGILFMGSPVLSFFHLLVHAFFSALLFLCAGLIIHVMGDNQDLRMMGGVYNSLPWTYTCFLISNFSLCGLPFMSGFYSKDMILDAVSYEGMNLWLLIIFNLSVGLTVAYTVRLVYHSTMSSAYCCQNYFEDKYMAVSMGLMLLMSILGGCFLSWIIFMVPEICVVNLSVKLFPLLMIMLGSILSYMLSSNCSAKQCLFMSWFFSLLMFMPNLSVFVSMKWGFSVADEYYKNLDYGWGEYLISSSVFNYFFNLSLITLKYYNNSVKLVLVSFLISFFLFLF